MRPYGVEFFNEYYDSFGIFQHKKYFADTEKVVARFYKLCMIDDQTPLDYDTYDKRIDWLSTSQAVRDKFETVSSMKEKELPIFGEERLAFEDLICKVDNLSIIRFSRDMLANDMISRSKKISTFNDSNAYTRLTNSKRRDIIEEVTKFIDVPL